MRKNGAPISESARTGDSLRTLPNRCSALQPQCQDSPAGGCFCPPQSYSARMIKGKRPAKPADLELQRRIQELIAFKGGGHNENEVADIIENALKLLADVKDTGDVRVIQTASARIALCLPPLRAVCARPQGHHFRLGPDAIGQGGISTGRGFRAQDCESRLHGHHRRRTGHHAGRARRRRDRKQFRREHPPAVGTKRESGHSPRTKNW